MAGVAARQQQETAGDGHAPGTLEEIAAAASAVAAAAARAGARPGDGSMLAGALMRLTEATAAAEELARSLIAVTEVDAAAHARGLAEGLAARCLRAL